MNKPNPKECKFYIRPDGSIQVDMNQFNPFAKRKIRSTYPARTPNTNMTLSDYERVRKDWFRNFKQKDIDSSKCLFVTLLLDQAQTFKTVSQKFSCFLTNLKNKCRDFGKLEYARAIEVQGTTKFYHIHTVLHFENLPKDFDST